MDPAAVLLALYLHRPVDLVSKVYAAGGTDAVALVECESNFNPRAVRREPRGHTSFGLFQVDNEWWPQHRRNLPAHIREGAAILAWCKANSGSFAGAVTLYNGSAAWGATVAKKRDELARWLAWRAVRELETAQ